jgi:hypothetical protein
MRIFLIYDARTPIWFLARKQGRGVDLVVLGIVIDQFAISGSRVKAVDTVCI